MVPRNISYLLSSHLYFCLTIRIQGITQRTFKNWIWLRRKSCHINLSTSNTGNVPILFIHKMKRNLSKKISTFVLRASNSFVRLKVGPSGKLWVEFDDWEWGWALSYCFSKTCPVEIATFLRRQVSCKGVFDLQLTSTGVTCNERLSISLTINYYNLLYLFYKYRAYFIMQGRHDNSNKKINRLQKERSPQPKSSLIQSFKGYLYFFTY